MNCPNCGALVKEHGPDRRTCPTCGDLVRNDKGEWEPAAAVPPVTPPAVETWDEDLYLRVDLTDGEKGAQE